jgi:toxin ParE1/3/4
MRLELSREADADVVGILEYGAVHYGWDRAEAYAASFDESFAVLLEHPRIGALYPDVRPPIHSWPHGSHRIYYDIEGDTIVVRRILHKSVDVARWLR